MDTAVISQQLTEETKKIQDAIGEKLSTSIKCLSSFVGGIALGLFYDYRFALSIFSFIPLVGVSAVFMFQIDTKMRRLRSESYQESNAVAEETFSGIRTVSSFGRERFQIRAYLQSLLTSKKVGIRFGPLKGLSMGILPMVMYGMFGFGFWYGGELIQYEGWSVGEMMSCLLCVLIGTMCLSIVFTNLEYFTTAKVRVRNPCFALFELTNHS